MNNAPTIDMTGKVVVMTGANAGIGRSTAEALAGMGATALACGRDAAKLDEAAAAIRASTGNQRVLPLVADQSDLDDLQSRNDFRWEAVYNRAKLAGILLSAALARRTEGTGVTSNAVHPGVVATWFCGDARPRGRRAAAALVGW